jgi:hypothetical protein
MYVVGLSSFCLILLARDNLLAREEFHYHMFYSRQSLFKLEYSATIYETLL